MRDKCLLIINPISGTASRKDVPVRTMRRLRREGIDVEVMYTEKAGDAAALAAMAASKGYLGVIAAGGDGTVNEIASSLVGTRTALGIIPLGSGNGLARHIGLTTDVGEALNLIARRHIEACDSCAADGRPFFCTFGLGFDAAVSEKFSRSRRRGLMNYLRSVMTEYLKYSPEEYEIEANGHTVRLKAFIAIRQHRFYRPAGLDTGWSCGHHDSACRYAAYKGLLRRGPHDRLCARQHDYPDPAY